MNRKWIQFRDLFAMRAHGGWVHALMFKLKNVHPVLTRLFGPVVEKVHRWMDARTQSNSALFDAKYGTETYSRMDVAVSADPNDSTRWGYAAINHDFFKEILRSIPLALTPYTFVDIGSGKGAAVLMASEFPFNALVGVELNPDLVRISQRNVSLFNAKTGRQIAPQWVQGDFFAWDIPNASQLFFFNNPFPEALTLQAIQRLEQSLMQHPRPTILVFRKAPQTTGDHLHNSKLWKPLRLAPYWRVYQSQVNL